MESNVLKIKTNKKHLYALYSQLLSDLNEIDSNFIDFPSIQLSKIFIDELKQNAINYPIDIMSYNDNDEEYELKEMSYEYNSENNSITFKGYPKNNLLFLLTKNILLCFLNKRFVFSFIEIKGLNDQTKEAIYLFNNHFTNKDEDIISGLLKKLTEREILTLFGFRKTPGSINTNFPPDAELLKSMFNEINPLKSIKPNVKYKPSILTVGAKALSKHSHRSKTEVRTIFILRHFGQVPMVKKS